MPRPSQPEHALARSPHEVGEQPDPVDELLRLACLNYGADDEARAAHALELLRATPSLGDANVHTMAVVGDHLGIAALLDADPSAANRPGGPFDWEPLLYAT